MRAFFADGMDEMHISWAVEELPTLLELSLFLFNVDREVFTCVMSWTGLFLDRVWIDHAATISSS
jgi:hypothetical protein